MRHTIVLLVVALVATTSAAQAQSKCLTSAEIMSRATQVERLQARIDSQQCQLQREREVKADLRQANKRKAEALGNTRRDLREERKKYAAARKRIKTLRQ